MNLRIKIMYLNWRGELRERDLTPVRIIFGSTEHHPEPQWLVVCIDHEDGKVKEFALLGFRGPVSVDK